MPDYGVILPALFSILFLFFVNFLIFYAFHAFLSYIFTKQSALLQYKPPSAKIYLMNQEQSALFNNCNYFKYIKL